MVTKHATLAQKALGSNKHTGASNSKLTTTLSQYNVLLLPKDYKVFVFYTLF